MATTMALPGNIPRMTRTLALLAALLVPVVSMGAVQPVERVAVLSPTASSPSRATEPALQAGTRSGAVGGRVGSDSNGPVVAHTLLVAISRYRAVVLRLRCPSNSWIVRRTESMRIARVAGASGAGLASIPPRPFRPPQGS